MKIFERFKDSPDFSEYEWKKSQISNDDLAFKRFAAEFSDEPTVLKPETLLNEEKFNSYNILRLLLQCTITLSSGSHTKTYQFDKDELTGKLEQMAKMYEAEDGALPEDLDQRIAQLATYLADKFVLKVGRTKDFKMALTSDDQDPNSLDRKMMADTFAEAGYNILPTPDQIHGQTQTANAVVPFFGNSDEMNDTFVPGLIKKFFASGCDLEAITDQKHNGQTLVSNLRGGRLYSMFEYFKDLASENLWRRGMPEFDGIEDMETLKKAQQEIRSGILSNPTFAEALTTHFKQTTSLGYRALMRRLKGEKRSDITLEAVQSALGVAAEFAKDENYIVDESTYAAPIPEEVTPELIDNNLITITCFKRELEKKLPDDLILKVPEEALNLLISSVLNYHHDLPDFDLDSDVGIISSSTAKLAIKALSNLSRIASGKLAEQLPTGNLQDILKDKAKLPERRNTDFNGFVKNDPLIRETLKGFQDHHMKFFIEALEKLFKEYIRNGGIEYENGDLYQYKQIPSTFYLFQSRIAPAHDETSEECEVMTLKELIEDHEDYLTKYPDLVLKLLNYYSIILNYLYTTRLLLDVRHSDVGKDLFILGKWGLTTDNILVKIDKKAGETKIVHIDLRDQFEHFDPELYKKSRGVAKHGLHIIMEVFPEAIFNNIAYLAEKFYENEGEEVPKNDYSTPEKAARWVHSNVSQLISSSKRFTEAFVDQELHDSARLGEKIKKK